MQFRNPYERFKYVVIKRCAVSRPVLSVSMSVFLNVDQLVQLALLLKYKILTLWSHG